MWFLASPLSVALGAGISLTANNSDTGGFEGKGRGIEPTLDVIVGPRLDPHVSVGLRFKLSQTGFTHSDPYADPMPDDRFSMTTFDYAVAVQLEQGRAWIVPWVGMHDGYGHYKSTRYAADWTVLSSRTCSFSPEALVTGGVTFGIDIATKPNYRVTAYADAQLAGDGRLVEGASVYVNHYTYQAFMFGVAFRL